MAGGLNTDLKPAFGLNTEKHASNNIKGLLTAVLKTLLKKDF